MYGHGSQFGRKKQKAIDAMRTSRTNEEAAQKAGISVRTLQRWLKYPEFREAYLMARLDQHRQLIARTQQVSPAAINTLTQVMRDENAPASARVRAAGLLLDHSARGLDLDIVEGRLEALEKSNRIDRQA